MENIDFAKMGGLIPAVIQDNTTNMVLMLGFMNEEALRVTEETGRVTFFSRSRKKLWTKGEDNGEYLEVVSILEDYDKDALLIKVNYPDGMAAREVITSWGESNTESEITFLEYLQDLIDERKRMMPEGSYTTSLFKGSTRKIAQKVGEEAVETVIGAMAGDDENFIYEGADLLYHLMVLLSHKGYRIENLAAELKKRH
jgi:phosphoribosyl-AMP cyclohydrolase / phosphoribosyl-ATP pyrophosphohydrolase